MLYVYLVPPYFDHDAFMHHTIVVGKRREEGQKNRPEAQTKDRRPAIVWPCVSIMRRWAICFYWLAVRVGLGHMFLLCGAGPYVCIGWLWAWGWAICFYWLAVGVALGHMFVLVGCGPYISIVRVYVYMCVYVYMYVCVYVYVYVCVCDHMFS